MLAATALLTCLAAPAAAQDPADPNPGAITVSGAVDFTNAYLFRGIRQETEGLIMWPYLDLGINLYNGEGSLKSFGVNFGTWNSLHAGGDTGTPNVVSAPDSTAARALTTVPSQLSGRGRGLVGKQLGLSPAGRR